MPGTFFHVSCITYSSQPRTSIPRRAARLTLSLQCITKLKHTAQLPNGHRKHGRRERGGAGILTTYSSSSFCILLGLKPANNKPCPAGASPSGAVLLPARFSTLGTAAGSVCSEGAFPTGSSDFRARTWVYSRLRVFKRFFPRSESLGVSLPPRALSELFPP